MFNKKKRVSNGSLNGAESIKGLELGSAKEAGKSYKSRGFAKPKIFWNPTRDAHRFFRKFDSKIIKIKT